MSKYDFVNKEFIKTNKFVADVQDETYHQSANRLIKSDNLPPLPETQRNLLRQRFANIVIICFDKNMQQMEVNCNISESNMRRYLNGLRRITFYAVVKLCIGAKVSIETAEEMCKLQGHIIDANAYLFDAIFIDALKCHDDIGTFFDTCKEFGLTEILSKLDTFN